MAVHDKRSSVEFKVENEVSLGPTLTVSETTLISTRQRTSLPIVVAWWRNYRRDPDSKVVCDEEGTYRCIKQDESPPPEETEFSTSVESCTSPVYHYRVSRNNLKRSILELMKSTNSAGVSYLDDIEKGRMTAEEVEKIFSNCTDVEKNTALLCAALNGRVEILKALLEIKADIYCSEPTEGFTALHFSAFNDDVDCASYLISVGADVNYAPEKYTALETACFHNCSKVAKLLLESGAEINTTKESSSNEQTYQGTPLHSAVKANSIDCVQLLLSESMLFQIKEKIDSDYTPLHVAAEMGHLQCLKILLDAGIDPNLITPDTKSTALHFAAEGGFNECVSMLLSKGAKADARNFKGQTPLHLAARVHSLECVEILLQDGHCNPNVLDCDKKSPLHSAVGKSLNSSDIVEQLITKGADVNQEDIYGYTPLHVAAINENTPCVQVLMNNGANVTKKTKGGNSALGIIIRKTPLALPVLYKKLDNAIMVHDPEVSSSKEVLMKLDFRIFLQHCQKGEMDFLKTFLDEGQKEILEHPLCQAFLHIKWEKIRKYFITRLLFYAMLVLFLTAYVMVQCMKCGDPNQPCEWQMTANVLWGILCVLTVFEALRKTYAITGTSKLKHYMLRIDNIIEWFVLICNFIISSELFGRHEWQCQLAAFSILFAWFDLMLQIGQMPLLGSYVAMYIKVQKQFAMIFVAYSCLLIGFTLSFCIIYQSTKNFENPGRGFIQIIAFMIGALDYKDIVLEPCKPNDELNLNTTSSPIVNFNTTMNAEPDLPASAHIIFFMFMLFVTIIMWNLLVGIAVRDIQGLEKTAGISRLVRQTKLISSIEHSVFKNWLPKYLLTFLRHTALISPSGYRVVLQVKPLNHQEKRLPKDIMQHAYEIAKARKRGVRTPSVTSRILSFIGSRQNSVIQEHIDSENINKLQREVEVNNIAITRLTKELEELKEILKSFKK